MRGTYFTTALRINNQAADYTANILDWEQDTITTMTSGSANNYIIPLNSSVNFPIGTQLLVAQEGLGQTTIVATSGVTINAVGLSISSRYKSVALIQVALNEWDAYGTLDASLYTARTTAFASATAITDTTILNALNTFDLGLISNGLDTKMKAIYPFVGSTATTQKYNFMDARDLDVAFRLQFFGGGTFSANGYQPNGTNAYANTYVTPSTNLASDNLSISYYSRTNVPMTVAQVLFDSFQGAGQCLQLFFESNILYFDNYNGTDARVSVAESRSQGMYMGNRLNATINKIVRNGSVIASIASGGTGIRPTIPIYMSAANTSGGAVAFNSLQTAFGSIGNGLTDTEATTFYNLVQAMQVSLARAV